MSSNQKIYTFGVLTLGCKVNQYESEAIAEKLFFVCYNDSESLL